MISKNRLNGQKSLSILLITSLLLVTPSWAEESFSIFLVRHAEKQTGEKNPSLTTCGLFRAKQLATLLSQSKVSSVYSTSYQRTMQTAQPLAKLNNVPVKNYNPKHLEQLALQLTQQKETVLIVGHSNTTPLLTELLIDRKVTPLTEEDYQFLYQVQFIGEQKNLTVFKQPLNCKN